MLLECGPDAVLSALGRGCVREEQTLQFVTSLRKGQNEERALASAFGALFVHGVSLSFASAFGSGKLVELPTYAFQHERYWLSASSAASGLAVPSTVQDLYRVELELVTAEARVASPATSVLLGDGELSRDSGLNAYGELSDLLCDVERQGAPGRVIVDTTRWGASLEGSERVHAVAAQGLALLQELMACPELIGSELVWVTRGALAPWSAHEASAASLLGLLRVARSEYPERALRSVDLVGESDVEAVLHALDGTSEPELTLEERSWKAPRLRPVSEPAEGQPSLAVGTVLISGGTGELGQALALHLVRKYGAKHLVLTSRRGAAGLPEGFVAELEGSGALSVDVFACDVASRRELAEVLAQVKEPLTGVFHLAGVLDDGLLSGQTSERLERVLRPKVDGALNLHEQTAGMKLAAFVLFSSTAGVFGGAGQGSYAAANAFMDGLASARRAQGLVATSLSWGLWKQSGVGMTAHLGAAELSRMERYGFHALSLTSGLALLDQALARPGANFTPVRLDVAQYAKQLRGGEPPALMRSLISRPTVAVSNLAKDAQLLRASLLELAEPERKHRLERLVAAEVAVVLGLKDAARLNLRKGFVDLGFDSLMAVELSRQVQARTGVVTPKTLTFDYPSVEDVASWLLEQLTPELSAAVESTSGVALDRNEAVAIVGVGLRLPGGVNDLASYWELLASERDTLREIPADRFDIEAYYDPDQDAEGKSYVRAASFLDDVAGFDAGFFGISPREARPMDPQHRLLLEAGWTALEDAGLEPSSLKNSDTGVFVGAVPGDYAGRASNNGDHVMTGSAGSFNAGRVSYHLGLQGPALTVDTACSSSLVALQLACSALRRGECSVALAAGVQVLASAEAFVILSGSQALSPEGRSKAFSAGADGYGRGEGVGVLALMRLSDAQAGGHRVLGVVRGVAVNHDGASSGITAPNGLSQQKVLRSALRDAGLSAQDVDYVECHGTGTVLGDPIEVQALGAVYGRDRADTGALQLGAVKSNVGHLEAASGMAGVLKVLACFQQGALPASLHSHL